MTQVEPRADPGAIVTDRLVLTPLVVEDAEAMVDVLGDERMYEFTGGRPPTLDDLRSRYARLAVGRSSDGGELWFNWIVRLADQHTPVGVMQATVAADGSSADVAWEIGVGWQGRGIASETAVAVVEWLVGHDVAVIKALIHPDHEASARVAARAGLAATRQMVDGEIVWLAAAEPGGRRTIHQVQSLIAPPPSDEEAAAIVAAVDALWPRPGTAPELDVRRPSVWKFSGRWWSQPIPLRRARPWV